MPKKTPFAVPKTAVASCGFELDWRKKESRKVMSLQSPVAPRGHDGDSGDDPAEFHFGPVDFSGVV